MHALKWYNFLKLKNLLEGILPFLSDFKLKQNKQYLESSGKDL